jgi:hypothetical protein
MLSFSVDYCLLSELKCWTRLVSAMNAPGNSYGDGVVPIQEEQSAYEIFP